MLQHITWGQYLTATGILILLYYIIIVLLYYRDEAIQFLRKGPVQLSPASNTTTGKAADKDEIFDGLESVVADLGGILKEAGTTIGKPELLGQLKDRLTSYAGFRHPAFRHAINNYIISHGAAINKQTFDEEELNRYWDGPPDQGKL